MYYPGKYEEDEHQYHGRECQFQGKKTNHANLGQVKPSDELKEGGRIEQAHAIHFRVEYVKNIVTINEARKGHAGTREEEDQRCDTCVAERCYC